MEKTRAEAARDYLSAKLVDRPTNFAMNEAYRLALDEMVEYIDFPKGPNTSCNHNALDEENTLEPILKPISRAKDGKPNAKCKSCKAEFAVAFEKPMQ